MYRKLRSEFPVINCSVSDICLFILEHKRNWPLFYSQDERLVLMRQHFELINV